MPPAAAVPGGPTGQNDAGSGHDAGDSPYAALLVSGARHAWSANLTPPGSDADWYRRPASAAFCAVASATTNAPGLLILASDPGEASAVSRPVDPHAAQGLALAAPGGRAPYLGLEPMSLVQTFGTSSGPPSPGRYTFEFATRSLADLDPERDGEVPEAGATPATSAPLPPACAAGRLHSSAGDVQDRYHIDIVSGAEMSFSFAVASGPAARATLLTPTGAAREVLSSGDARTVWMDEPGRWILSISSDGAATLPTEAALGLAVPSRTLPTTITEYLLGTSGEPDPEPCRPTCRR